ncbi:MAG TPA: DUF4432 family protein [Gaiellaceae bacterium]|nr:DUF4432 family protein [Gaiellaceae bacterium]
MHRLANADLEVGVDLDRGSDVVSLVDRRTGVDVMFRTPWAERAEQVARRGSLLGHGGSYTAWLESYAGGWQLLCPNAGPPTERAGIVHGFHGEVSLLPWTLVDGDGASARLRVELHTVPLAIERTISLQGPVVAIDDVVRNLAPVPVEFDYQHHPAFGPPLLAPGCALETGARTYVADPGPHHWRFEPGEALAWPPAADGEDALDTIPSRDRPRALLGWLEDFAEPWAALRNPELDLGIAVRWDASVMPYAWLWQELAATEGYPWYRRAYVMAFEPSSTPTDGPRRTSLRLEAESELAAGIRLAVCGGTRPIRSVDADGGVRFADA